MQISVRANTKSKNRAISQHKSPKIRQSLSNQFSIPIANVSVTLQGEKLQTNTWTIQDKTRSNSQDNHFDQYNEVQEKPEPVYFTYVWITV